MIRLKKNQHAMFHSHTISATTIDYIIRHIDAVQFINNLTKKVASYTKDDYLRFSYVRDEVRILEELEQAIDIWDDEV